MGADFVGEEINDIGELEPVIRELVAYSKTDPYFTIRIHAGENDSLKDNVTRAVDIVLDSLDKGQKMPKLRIGHGIYTTSLKTKKGKDLIRKLKQNNVILEFQLTSNVRLNNLTVLDAHPIKEFLKNGVSAVQGSDGCGIYGTNSLDEELALRSLLKLDSDDFKLMCATEDKKQETIMDIIKSKRKDLVPVGRLDKDTEGLILITNDGKLNHDLLSPENHVDKKYYIEVDNKIMDDAQEVFSNPIDLGDFVTKPSKLEILGDTKAYLTISEGKFHQVKRMFKFIGCEVTYLKRVQFKNLNLEGLEIGDYRHLTDEEILDLKNY